MLSLHSPVVILGSGGLLGRHVVDEFARMARPYSAFSHQQLDLTDDAGIVRELDRLQPEVIINCAAICHFQRCQEDPALSARVNRDAPIRLADIAAQRGIRLVHFSTDYIFDGRSTTPYREQDPPNPLSVYGQHKAALEAAFEKYPDHLLLRVAWLFGESGKTFLSLLPNLLMQRETLEVAAGKSGSCLHAACAAEIIRRLVEQNASGRFNLVHSGATSWEEFAHECLRQLRERGYQPACRNLIEVPLEKMAALAGSRPLYSVLDVSKLTQALGHAPTDWTSGLGKYLDRTHPALRAAVAI